MANITIFKVEQYNKAYYKTFSGIYNDFKQCAKTDYNFELAPLEYDAFIKSIEDGLLKCLILFEDEIPTAFLVYTTIISESVELNIIHCIGSENINSKRKLLMEKFIELNMSLLREKVVTYPLLGKQSSFAADIQEFGFKLVNTNVMMFDLKDKNALKRVEDTELNELPREYSITNWKTIYFKDAAEVIHQSFKDSSDALFDPRFLTINGSRDILEKITDNIYGEFLPGVSKVLIYKKRPVGVCFANLTNNSIANIPIVGILKKHRNKGLGKYLLKNTVENLINSALSGGWGLTELNASCDSDSIPSVNMYSAIGFTKHYAYSQAYRPKTN